MSSTQKKMLRYVTIRLKWKTGLKAAFHFNRIVMYRSIFFCVEVISSTLVLRKQRNTLCFGTIRLKWKTGYGDRNLRERPSFAQQSRHICHYAYNFGQLENIAMEVLLFLECMFSYLHACKRQFCFGSPIFVTSKTRVKQRKTIRVQHTLCMMGDLRESLG